MRELSEQLYLTRREFLKAVGISVTVLATSCLDFGRYF
ncbi:MAG: twin-arginine translocation signal domain-containing protein [Euryarchaeota archaeon]|nr:twin-arginine translocation signal domain-containing protein [Euryarchaeota archaeon]